MCRIICGHAIPCGREEYDIFPDIPTQVYSRLCLLIKYSP